MQELKQQNFNYSISAPGEPHLACVLLLDTSASMKGDPIINLNQSIEKFIIDTSKDEVTKRRVDVAIIEFNNHAKVVQDFTPLYRMKPIKLSAGGETAMGEGINLAIDKIKERNIFYAKMGTPCFRPWIFMITDGMNTDSIEVAKQRIFYEENKGKYGKLKFWAVGAGSKYDEKILLSLTKRCIALNKLEFENIFNWFSESMVIISVSCVDENPKLPNLPEDAHVIPHYFYQ